MVEMLSLDKVPERHLRAVLDALCKEPSVETKVKNMLEQLQRVEKTLSLEDSRGSKTAGVKRKPDELVQICIHCDEAFCDETNFPTACTSHESDAEMEPDYDGDFWADHDEMCHGTIDSDFCREEYPDGFIWTCCEKLGSEEGCREHPHKARQDARLKT